MTPYQPYADVHQSTQGPGDARPTGLQIVQDLGALGKLRGKTILITGCSSGIGKETAIALLQTGAKLFLTARDMPKLHGVIADMVRGAEGKDLPPPEPLQIDLSSMESVRKGAESFIKRSTQLNIMINNAGVMACPYQTTNEGFESQMGLSTDRYLSPSLSDRHIGTNHFSHFLLFQLLKPLLLTSAKESRRASRVINLSSSGHRFEGIRFDDMNFSAGRTYDRFKAYAQSKTANIYMASSIERRYGAQGLRGLSVHPGGVMTELTRHMTAQDLQAAGFDEMAHLFKNAKQGAATTVWAALDPHFETQSGGRYLADCGVEGPFVDTGTLLSHGYHPHTYNEEAEEKLWELSCKAVGVPVVD